MNIQIKGKGSHTLNNNDFVASGGEGSIYRKGNVAFKIYTDPKKMIPVDKIDELSVLTLPNIIRPQDIIIDGKNHPIGYTMRFVKDTYALCQLFPKAFRDRFSIKPPSIIKLVKELQGVVDHCHSKGILIVDLNEMNFLIDDSFSELYAIDCDSYKTKSFPPTAIMDSIRDRHATDAKGRYKASTETDWFSFGIVSFQMMIGIHPFKGKHPKIKDLDERMLKNISVLNRDVSIPAACQPLTDIPQSYKDWFKAIFEEGKRLPPPLNMQAVITVAKTVKISGSNNFTIKKLQEIADEIIRFDAATRLILSGTEAINLNGKREALLPKAQSVMGLSPDGQLILATIAGGKIVLTNITRGMDIGIDVAAQSLMSYAGRVYLKEAGEVHELRLMAAGTQIVPTIQKISSVLENASKFYDGVLIQDMLGACYVSIFPETKMHYQLHVKELDGARVIDAKFDNNVLMIVVFKAGKYDKYILRLNKDLDEYDVRIESDISTLSLNFVTMPTGICIHLNDKEELEIFRNEKGSQGLKTIDDPVLSGDMKLFRNGTQAMFSNGNQLFSFEVKKP